LLICLSGSFSSKFARHPDSRHFRGYPLSGHAADIPKSTRMTPERTSRRTLIEKQLRFIFRSLTDRKVLGFGYCTRQASTEDSMKRREFITILGGAAATQVIRPGVVRAGTSPKRPIIGILGFWAPNKIGQSFLNLFRQGLQDLGYVLGRHAERCLPLAHLSPLSTRS